MARNLDKYKVQAYQSPYTQELFIDEKDFQRHLNTQAKYKKERDAKRHYYRTAAFFGIIFANVAILKIICWTS